MDDASGVIGAERIRKRAGMAGFGQTAEVTRERSDDVKARRSSDMVEIIP